MSFAMCLGFPSAGRLLLSLSLLSITCLMMSSHASSKPGLLQKQPLFKTSRKFISAAAAMVMTSLIISAQHIETASDVPSRLLKSKATISGTVFSVADGDIPNIYQTANVSANTITFTNFHTSNLDATSNTLVVYEGGDTRKDLNIVEVVDEHTIRVDTEVSGEDVFVFGQVVQDFHHLNKDYLWTIATSALQEVDRQLQAEKARNDRLEARLQALETALAIS